MEQRPNIILLMADQLRGDCLGIAGHPDVKTPLDAMMLTMLRRVLGSCRDASTWMWIPQLSFTLAPPRRSSRTSC